MFDVNTKRTVPFVFYILATEIFRTIPKGIPVNLTILFIDMPSFLNALIAESRFSFGSD